MTNNKVLFADFIELAAVKQWDRNSRASGQVGGFYQATPEARDMHRECVTKAIMRTAGLGYDALDGIK